MGVAAPIWRQNSQWVEFRGAGQVTVAVGLSRNQRGVVRQPAQNGFHRELTRIDIAFQFLPP